MQFETISVGTDAALPQVLDVVDRVLGAKLDRVTDPARPSVHLSDRDLLVQVEAEAFGHGYNWAIDVAGRDNAAAARELADRLAAETDWRVSVDFENGEPVDVVRPAKSA